MTFPGWIDQIGPFDVQRMEGPRPGGQAYLELNENTTKRVIWHTTEGNTVVGAVARLREQFSAPHFVIGEGRIVQMRPLWAQAATVRGDNSRAWQVEVVEHSQTTLWMPQPGSLNPMVALLAFFRDELDVPLRRPDGWHDNGSDIKGVWATEGNSRRVSERALTFVGHVMHLEWPDNTHWDQGAINWTRIFEIVEEDMADERLDHLRDGVRAFWSGVTLNPDWPLFKQFGYNLAERGEERPKTSAHTHPYAPVNHEHDPAADHTHTVQGTAS